MVCKEELCVWFKNLSPHKRIDYLCGMLHICLPLELRFVGSYVEDLAKKDSVHLREHEGKANNREELSKFYEIDAKSFRTRMAIYLALLRSSNRTCSSLIYQLLENHIKQTLTVMDNMDEMTVHNILLVLSMAMNHPAFNYHEKIRMYGYYNTAYETAKLLFNKTQMPTEQELLIPSLILSESCETRGCDQRVSPAISPQVPLHPSHPTPSDFSRVHVTKIDVKGSRHKDNDKRTLEYKIQVTWSNGEKKEVFKTSQEILDFQNKLKQKFPDEPSLHQETGLISENTGPQNNRSVVTDGQNLYTKALTDLPPHVLHTYLVSCFFDPSLQQPVQMTDASTSPRPQNGLDLPMMQLNSNTSGDMHSLSPHSPAHLDLGYTGSAHSPSCSTKTTSPLISSPSCQSPESSVESPCNSHPSSPSPLDTEPSSLHSHLRSHNLPLDNDILDRFSIQQLHEMRIEDIENLGLSKEAALTLKTSIGERMRSKMTKVPNIPNGVIDPAAVLMCQPPPPHTFLPPPNIQHQLPFPHPIHPPFCQSMYGFHPFSSQVMTGRQEISPTNSEYSSPSQSPHLISGGNQPSAKIPVTDSSSEDSDQDKLQGQPKPYNKSKGHSHGSSSRLYPQESVKEETCQDSNSNSETPPLNCERPGFNGKPGQQGNSGYTSDPTYNAPRPQLVRPPYNKAIPAHTNLGIPPKYIINMPENSFKGGPMSIPQHLRDVTMTTGTNFHGYGMFAADPSHRPVFPVVGGHHPAILNRSHMNFVPKPLIQPGLLTSAQSPPVTGSQINVSSNNSAGKMIPGNPGLVLPIPTLALPTTQGLQTNSVGSVNSIDTCGHNQSPVNSDSSLNPRVPVISTQSTTTSMSVTQSVAGQSQSTSHCSQTLRSSCSSCGCTGHSSSTAPLHYMPSVPQNMWQIQNGMIPLQTMFMQHHPYLNGMNQEQLYNHTYGLVNHGGQGVTGNVPNYMYGYNYYNSNHNPNNNSNGGYNKKVKKTYCSNCGSNKHLAVDCTETTMEAMSGHIHYSYKNDSD